jgi:predicted dithiol-disulfide oxidoreductase (DUF899 family)
MNALPVEWSLRMENHHIVSQEEWIEARKQHLAREKEFTRLRDELAAQRRNLPWVRVDKAYQFEGPNGKESLSELFAGKSQLVIQHFMFAADWKAGCKSCSFWADGYNGMVVHLAHRDVAFVVVSTAPLARIEAFRKRMGWNFKWVSSSGTDFNHDFHVTFAPEELANGPVNYNYGPRKTSSTELPGISAFYRDEQGTVFHTYSCYERGLDMMNAAYHYLDLVPKGRDESSLPHPQAWVRLHDEYRD